MRGGRIYLSLLQRPRVLEPKDHGPARDDSYRASGEILQPVKVDLTEITDQTDSITS